MCSLALFFLALVKVQSQVFMILTFLPNVFIVANNCVSTLALPVVVGVETFQGLKRKCQNQGEHGRCINFEKRGRQGSSAGPTFSHKKSGRLVGRKTAKAERGSLLGFDPMVRLSSVTPKFWIDEAERRPDKTPRSSK